MNGRAARVLGVPPPPRPALRASSASRRPRAPRPPRPSAPVPSALTSPLHSSLSPLDVHRSLTLHINCTRHVNHAHCAHHYHATYQHVAQNCLHIQVNLRYMHYIILLNNYCFTYVKSSRLYTFVCVCTNKEASIMRITVMYIILNIIEIFGST